MLKQEIAGDAIAIKPRPGAHSIDNLCRDRALSEGRIQAGDVGWAFVVMIALTLAVFVLATRAYRKAIT